MKRSIFIFSTLLLCGWVEAGPLSKASKQVMVKNSHFIIPQDFPTMEGEEHFKAGLEAYEKKSYEEAIRNFRLVNINFASEPYAVDAPYYLGVCNYELGELDIANDAFSAYLQGFSTPQYFQQAIDYKFTIAERLKSGEKKHILGYKFIPKLFNGKALAVEIYDEVIAALPSHEYAARALYAKGVLLKEMKEFRESVESLQTLIKRFPRHELAPECYLAITKVYLDQCQYEFQNPDLITFSEINLRKFSFDFPRETRIEEMKNDVAQIKEIYAKGLYDTGQYYERTDKWHASLFCYRNAKEKFPETQAAKQCEERIAALETELQRLAKDDRDPRFRNNRVKNVAPKKTV